jgi:hypothetical protein
MSIDIDQFKEVFVEFGKAVKEILHWEFRKRY